MKALIKMESDWQVGRKRLVFVWWCQGWVEPEIRTNSFSLQIYTAKELQTLLRKNGFEIIHQYDMEGNDFIADKSLNILTVARMK